MLMLLTLLACSGAGGEGPVNGTLVSLEEAPVNCTLKLKTSAGEQAHRAHYGLCRDGDKDARSLVGKPVTATLVKSNVQKESCAGKTNCMDLEEVIWVGSLTAK